MLKRRQTCEDIYDRAHPLLTVWFKKTRDTKHGCEASASSQGISHLKEGLYAAPRDKFQRSKEVFKKIRKALTGHGALFL